MRTDPNPSEDVTFLIPHRAPSDAYANGIDFIQSVNTFKTQTWMIRVGLPAAKSTPRRHLNFFGKSGETSSKVVVQSRVHRRSTSNSDVRPAFASARAFAAIRLNASWEPANCRSQCSSSASSARIRAPTTSRSSGDSLATSESACSHGPIIGEVLVISTAGASPALSFILSAASARAIIRRVARLLPLQSRELR